MKQFMKRVVLFVALYVATMVACYAQGVSQVEAKVNEIVKKYEKTQGVECMTVVKGSGLGMLKTMLRGQFGKEFMKGVTGITIIEYSDASEETCTALHKDLDIFLTLLEEFDVSEEEKYEGNDYIRCFADVSDSQTISDFIMAMEGDESKMLMYMSGKIKIE
jgi:arylsulfatase A-like enzyme